MKTDVYRSSGAGGQHVNKTESAVRITHVPSGIVVACQTERSQHANRDRAMKMLAAKLYESEIQKRNAEKDVLEASKSDIGWGVRFAITYWIRVGLKIFVLALSVAILRKYLTAI